MIGCLRTHVGKQPIIVLYFESETVLNFITSRPGLEQETSEALDRSPDSRSKSFFLFNQLLALIRVVQFSPQ